MKVLFVCEGNKMRSPMAEAFYNELTQSHDAISAGADPYPLGGSFPDVVAAMKEKDVVLDHGSQLVTQQMVDEADVVVAFPTPMMPDFVLDSPKTVRWEIDDPYYQTGDRLKRIYHARDMIEARVKEMISYEN